MTPLNHRRLPIGWWQIYDDAGGVGLARLNYTGLPQRNYTKGALKYIDKAFQWGAK